MSALQAVVRPDGLEAIVGADDAAWLAAEARKAKERVERYDGADGAAGLFGDENASDGEGNRISADYEVRDILLHFAASVASFRTGGVQQYL